jgi:predicted nucleotidyltransferase
MKKINNPNDIVDEFVTDYRNLFGDELISVVMYGSAVTHEYRPGISDINTVVVLKDHSIERIQKCLRVAKKWAGRKVAVPFFMTKPFISFSLDSYPVEFLDIQSNYRVLFGEDVFAQLDIQRDDLRLQCERELRGISIHLRKEFVQCYGNPGTLSHLLHASMKKLLPVFKAVLRLNNKPVPKMKNDVIMAIEDLYNLGVSALSEALQPNRLARAKQDYSSLFDKYSKTIDALIERIDRATNERVLV